MENKIGSIKTVLSYTFPAWEGAQILKFVLYKSGLRVLTFHYASDEDGLALCRYLSILRKMYDFLDPYDFEAVMSGRKKSRKPYLLLSFDDGFKSNRHAAESILGPLGIKACFFIPSGFIGLSEYECRKFIADRIFEGNVMDSHFKNHITAMNWDDVRWLSKNGHRIGSHTVNHIRLSNNCGEDFLKREIYDSADHIEKEIKKCVDMISFPFGTINSITHNALAMIARRYRFCFSGIRGINYPETNPMAIRRDVISFGDSCAYLRFQAAGGSSFLYLRSRQKLDFMAKSLC